MFGDKEKVKEDVLKNPKHVLVCIQFLVIQGKPIFEAYKEFCKILGNDAMSYGDFDFWWFRFLNGEFDLDYDRNKEPKKRELGDMPIKIVKKIIENLEKKERYALPNVSKRIRNLMEDSNLLISDLSLSITCIAIHMSFNGRNALFEKCDGTQVIIGDFKTHVKGNYMIIAFKHLSRILKNPNLRFDTFRVDFNRNHEAGLLLLYLYDVKQVFQAINHRIHVENLELKIIWEHQLMAILPYLKPGVLETIEIVSGKQELCKMRDFVQLEQFKQAKSFTLDHFNAPIENLFHFNFINVKMKKITEEDVIRFKNAFIASSDFKHCSLRVVVSA